MRRLELNQYLKTHSACALCLVALLAMTTPASAWHFEVSSVDGSYRVTNGSYSSIQGNLALGSVDKSLGGECGTGQLRYDLAVQDTSFSFYVLSSGNGGSSDSTCVDEVGSLVRADIELIVVADPGDAPTVRVVVNYTAAAASTCPYEAEIGADLWISGQRVSLGCVNGGTRTIDNRVVVVNDSARVRLSELGENSATIRACCYMEYGSAQTTFDLRVDLLSCGEGTLECPKPVILLVTGYDSHFYEWALQKAAEWRYASQGWAPRLLTNPTPAELLSNLGDDCVHGLHISAHGHLASNSIIYLQNGAGGKVYVTPAQLGAATNGRRMDVIAPLACNQTEEAWRAGFQGAQSIVLPINPVGAQRQILSGIQFWSALRHGHSVSALACGDTPSKSASDAASWELARAAADCASFSVCDSMGCGEELYPTIACAVTSDVPTDGLISATAPDGFFSVAATFDGGYSDTVTVLATSFVNVPPDLMPEQGISIHRNMVVSVIASDPDAVPANTTIVMKYFDNDWRSAGIAEEESLRVFWVDGLSAGRFAETTIDTSQNTATFVTADGGAGGIYGALSVTAVQDEPGHCGEPAMTMECSPNPFNPRTTIRFDLPAAGQVRLAVYDLAGRLVRVLVEGERAAGSHEAVWDGRDATGRSAPSGSYLARLVAGGKVEGVRLSLVR